MLEKGLIELIDDYSFEMHFADVRHGRMPGKARLVKVANYETKDRSKCEINLKPNNGAKTIFTTIKIEYAAKIVDQEVMEAHKKNFWVCLIFS